MKNTDDCCFRYMKVVKPLEKGINKENRTCSCGRTLSVIYGVDKVIGWKPIKQKQSQIKK